MKRFASHYVCLPGMGFLKQQVVTVSAEGIVENVCPLTEEVESVAWMPGVIALLSAKQLEELEINGALLEKAADSEKKAAGFEKNTAGFEKNTAVFEIKYPHSLLPTSHCLQEAVERLKQKDTCLYACLFYPFDFTSMQPVGETRHKLLR